MNTQHHTTVRQVERSHLPAPLTYPNGRMMARDSVSRMPAWEAVCSCGWVSRPQVGVAQAENEATDHVVALSHC